MSVTEAAQKYTESETMMSQRTLLTALEKRDLALPTDLEEQRTEVLEMASDTDSAAKLRAFRWELRELAYAIAG